MSKPAKTTLTEVEKFYIQSNPENLDAIALSKKLKKPAEAIQKVLDAAKKVEPEKPKEEATEKKSKNDSFFRQTMARPQNKGKKIATAMTGTASQIADAGKKKGGVEKLNHVFKPYKDE